MKRVEFWSSAEFEAFHQGILRELRKRGVDAIQKFQVSQSDYRREGGIGWRLWLRFQMYAIYPLQLLRASLRPQKDVMRVVCTNTFYVPWIALWLRRWSKVQVIHLVYDLYPDVLWTAGVLKPTSLWSRVLDWFAKAVIRSSDANVFLGRRLLRHGEHRFGTVRGAELIPVGAEASPYSDSPPVFDATESELTVLYCGNLGRMHDYNTVATLLHDGTLKLKRSVRFRFQASGHSYATLKKMTETACPSLGVRVEFGGALANREWIQAMRQAEVALVTMRVGAEKVLLPSKVYSALAAGQAILAVCHRESDLADLVVENDCGWVVEPEDSAGLKRVVERIATEPKEVFRKRQNAFQCGQNRYDVRSVAVLWHTLFNKLENGTQVDAPAGVAVLT